MTANIVFKKTNGTTVAAGSITSFSFRKEVYQPFSSFSAAFSADNIEPHDCSEVLFYLNSKLVHHGIIDSLKVTNGVYRTGAVSSRSFTSMLLQNQLEPGLYTDMSINRLMDNMVQIPYVTHQDSDDRSGYIYVKYGSTLWDGIVNLSFKKYGTYPYIRGTNCVMFGAPETPESFTYSNSGLYSYGSGVYEKRLCSDFHMANIREEYGEFDLNDPDVSARNIVRHRYFELDRQFVYSPPQALEYRDKFAKRGWRRFFCTYSGYNGEDLFDLATMPGASSKPIAGITVTGKSSGISTEISVYSDGFLS